jgi:hypothetical protein
MSTVSNANTAPIIIIGGALGAAPGIVIGRSAVVRALETTIAYNRIKKSYENRVARGDNELLNRGQPPDRPPVPPPLVAKVISDHPEITMIACTIIGGVIGGMIFANLPVQ